MQKTYQSTLQVETKPKDPLEDVKILTAKGEYRKAFALIEDDNSLEALKLKAKISLDQKNYENAVKYFDEALEIDSDDSIMAQKADALYRWAKVTFFPEANMGKAMDLIDRALEIIPEGEESLEYWFLKGEIYQSEEHHIDARRCFLKAEQRLDELQILEDELDLFEVHRNDTLINVTGANFYRGLEVFKKGVVLKLVRDDDNEHDADAIACFIDDEIVGYVANSEYTLINGVKGASDIRRMIGDESEAEVLFIFQNEFVIAKVRS